MSYVTPVGSFSTWEEASTACQRCDFDPTLCIEYRPTTFEAMVGRLLLAGFVEDSRESGPSFRWIKLRRSDSVLNVEESNGFLSLTGSIPDPVELADLTDDCDTWEVAVN